MAKPGQRGPVDYRQPSYNFWQARMHKFLRLFPEDGTAVGSWSLLSGFLDNNVPSDHQVARERIRYTADTAVRHGFIRRLPQYGRSPNPGRDGRSHKECLWAITDEGLSVLRFLNRLEPRAGQPV